MFGLWRPTSAQIDIFFPWYGFQLELKKKFIEEKNYALNVVQTNFNPSFCSFDILCNKLTRYFWGNLEKLLYEMYA